MRLLLPFPDGKARPTYGRAMVLSRVRGRMLLLAMVLLANMTSVAHCRLVNYDDDPDLAAAMSADAEYNGGDVDSASQSLAEKYYLKYLEKCEESSQRAKVYCQLGALFATNWNARRGESPDYEKACMYLRKALEEEPVRIGRETRRARTLMVTPAQSAEDRLSLRMENYRWFVESQEAIDDATLVDEVFLPRIPGTPLSKNEIDTIRRRFRSAMSSQAVTLVDEAHGLVNPLRATQALKRIAETFPNTRAGEMASRRLASAAANAMEDLPAEVDVVGIAEVPSAPADPGHEARAEEAEASASRAPNGKQRGTQSYLWMLAGLAALGVFGLGARFRSSRNARKTAEPPTKNR